jgi:phage gp16-like protein
MPMREPSVRESYAPRLTAISRPVLLAGAAAIAAVGVADWLWAHYGATVFFETIRAGFAACFG